ncbi:MAG: hypothetical protein AB8B58_15965 [Roseobacter sp.]
MHQGTRFFLLALVALSACTQPVPNSGIGFDDPFLQQQQARDAALAQSTLSVPQTVLPPNAPLDGTTATVPATSAEATAAETARILDQTRPAPATPAAVAASSAVPNNPGLSQENDFDVVASRETIESDAARIADNRAQYTVVEPEALPTRPGSTGPNVVEFALATSHPVGTRLYARAGLNGEARALRNCAGYPSPDQAQLDFLQRGGPEWDRRGLDPDGDGYACSWNPEPFRKAAQG